MFLPTNKKDFDKLAQEVVAGFLVGESLAEGTVKVAGQQQLNPEEVRRLVEKANVTATVSMLKIATDKQVEFALADFDQVVALTHPAKAPEGPDLDKAASHIPTRIPDMYKADSDAVTFKSDMQKTASEDKPVSAGDVFRCRQKIEALVQEKTAAEMATLKGIEALACEFEYFNGPDFTKFACDAYTLDGDKARPVIETLARMLNCPAKVEKVAGIVDDTTKLLRKYAQVQDGLASIVDAQSRLLIARQEHAGLIERQGVTFSTKVR